MPVGAQALDQARKFTKSLEAFEGATKVDARKLFSSKATLALTQRLAGSRRIKPDTVQVVTPGEVYKFSAEDRNAVVTDLTTGSCTCLDFKHRRFVCKHMFYGLRVARKALTSLPQHVWAAPHMAIDCDALVDYSYVTHEGNFAKAEATGEDSTDVVEDDDAWSGGVPENDDHASAAGGAQASASDGAPPIGTPGSANVPTIEQRLKVAKSRGDIAAKEFVTQLHFMLDSKSVQSMELYAHKIAALVEEMQGALGGRRGDMMHAAGRKMHNIRYGQTGPRVARVSRKRRVPDDGASAEFPTMQGPGRPRDQKTSGLPFSNAANKAAADLAAARAAKRKKTTKPVSPCVHLSVLKLRRRAEGSACGVQMRCFGHAVRGKHCTRNLIQGIDTMFVELMFPVWGHTYRCGWRGVALVVGSLPKGKRLDQLPKLMQLPPSTATPQLLPSCKVKRPGKVIKGVPIRF